jgi:hypothetical protein
MVVVTGATGHLGNVLLDRGGPVVDTDGIRIMALPDDNSCCGADIILESLDAERIAEGIIRTPSAACSKQVVDAEGNVTIAFNIEVDPWAFDHPKEAKVRSMRSILQQFNTKLFAYPDRVEIHGAIPTQVLRVPEGLRGKWGQEFKSA